MAADRENAWLETLARESGIRRCLIVHGNAGDLCYSVDDQDYVPVRQAMVQALKRKGFEEVVVWDRVSGIQNVSDAVRERLERRTAAALGPVAQAGEDYDAGPAPARAPGQGAPASADPDRIFSMVYHALVQESGERTAFVIDGSTFLFGHANALSEQERQWLLTVSKALSDAPDRLEASSVGKPSSLLILLCNRLEAIPPPLYQNNPRVREIALPLPGRRERQEFLKRGSACFLLQKPLLPGSPAFDDFVDATDGLTIRDLHQIARLSRQSGEPLTADKLINLYRHGEKTSPWEEMSRQKLRGIEESLRKSVKGQDEAIRKVRSVVVRAYTGLSGVQHSRRQRTPKGILFFTGPTGVGKTELAKAIARFLFGDEDACLRFDMSEYNHDHSDQRLVGAPPSYVGYEAGGQLTNAVKRRPFSVLLFDEIEKAHGKILDKFLQILEDGRLTDGKGETVSFSDTVIIFTSNIGAAEVALSGDPAKVREQFRQKVKEYFLTTLGRPELLNRIGDNLVPFNFITSDDFLVDIARAKLAPLRERLKEKYRIADLAFDDEEKALKAVVAGLDRANGGRGVQNEIEARLIDPLGDFLFGEEEDPALYAGRTIRVAQAGKSASFGFTLV